MTEIMKAQVELALKNRHVTAPSQPEPLVAVSAAGEAERSKADKLQEAMEAEAKRRTQQISDDRKRKFNSLEGSTKEVTGGRCARRCRVTDECSDALSRGGN
jgi:hypothetical protein